MNTKTDKLIYWTPRVVSILFILFLAMFSLDVFDGNLGFWGTVVGLFMHNIPVFILAIVLWISWKREIVGGVGFILAGLAYIAALLFGAIGGGFQWYMVSWAVIIAGPAFLVGALFIINWRKRKLHASEPHPGILKP